MTLNSIEEIIEDIRNGKMVVIMDDEDRENEGDLVMAAEHTRPEDINFMARYARGLICLTLTRERCEQLRLPLMVSESAERHGTNFTLSIEAAEGVTTGISAHDRAHTVVTAVNADAKPDDLVQPGHIFPLMARPGGVLTRAGHTEAGCDFARLAGLEPAAAIVEILNDDGTMARRPDLEKFAQEHDLKIGTVADLIRYRTQHEHAVERLIETEVNTEFGKFQLVTYEDTIDRTVHIALIKGEITPDEPTLVRVHIRNTLSDTLGLQDEIFGWPLRSAMQRLAKEGSGVVVVLRPPETASDIIDWVQELNLSGRRDANREQTEAKEEIEQSPVLRTYGIGAQILRDLGVRKMRVLSAPKRMQAISGFGLEVVEYVEPVN